MTVQNLRCTMLLEWKARMERHGWMGGGMRERYLRVRLCTSALLG